MSKDYYCVRVTATPCNADITDLAADMLAGAGFESFEPDDSGLNAYIPADTVQSADAAGHAMSVLGDDFPYPGVTFGCSAERIAGCDWNEEWEKNYFKPIVIENRCVVHSSFHTDIPESRYDIVIDPKMAFGTGHHHTTSRMAAWLLEEELADRSLIDMGTGTGILAILASMRGARPVTGIEIDPGAYENAVENVTLNHCDIRLICGDAESLDAVEPADYLLANINRNIILADIDRYAKALRPGGVMLLSGFYDHDLPMVSEAAAQHGLTFTGSKESDRWIAARYEKI